MIFESTSWVAHFSNTPSISISAFQHYTARILQVSPRSPSEGPVYIYTRTNMYTSYQDTRPYLSPLFNQTYICIYRFFCSDKISHMIDNECFSGFQWSTNWNFHIFARIIHVQYTYTPNHNISSTVTKHSPFSIPY